MTAPEWWCLRLAEAVAEVTTGVRALAVKIADDWPDAHGRAHADRLALLHRALARETDAVAALVRSLPVDALVVPAASRAGPRLAGTDAERVGGQLGMRLPEAGP